MDGLGISHSHIFPIQLSRYPSRHGFDHPHCLVLEQLGDFQFDLLLLFFGLFTERGRSVVLDAAFQYFDVVQRAVFVDHKLCKNASTHFVLFGQWGVLDGLNQEFAQPSIPPGKEGIIKSGFWSF